MAQSEYPGFSVIRHRSYSGISKWLSESMTHLSIHRFTAFILALLSVGNPGNTGANPIGELPGNKSLSFRSARTIPFELHNNHIYLQVRVNGSEPLSFILDTGARTAISIDQARMLGLVLNGKDQTYGTGEHPTKFSTAKEAAFNLSGVDFIDNDIQILPLKNLESAEQHRIDGIIGFNFFSWYVVEIDYAAGNIILFSPSDFKYSGTEEPLRIEEAGQAMFVKAIVKPANHAPISGWFQIDTGGAHALILNRPLVDANKLLTPDQEKKVVLAKGIGASGVVMGSVESLSLGKQVINNPATLFSRAKAGFFASREFSGSIGGAVLKKYRVILDYPHRHLFVEIQSTL
jgi:hypothetical protein